jgi:hypothetical protein
MESFKRWYRRAIFAILVAALLIDLLYLCWRRPQGELKDNWFSSPPETLSYFDMQRTARDRVLDVNSALRSEACRRLEQASFVSLTDAEVHKFCGATPVPGGAGLKPYLMRAVCVQSPTQQCAVLQKGQDVWMACGMLTHHPVDAVYHLPVIVYLASPPAKVYVTFSQAE